VCNSCVQAWALSDGANNAEQAFRQCVNDEQQLRSQCGISCHDDYMTKQYT
jgi:hypothetical protein